MKKFVPRIKLRVHEAYPSKALLLSLGVSFVLTGCAWTARDERAEQALKPALHNAYQWATHPQTPSDASEFWALFGSEELMQLIAQTQRSNRDLGMALSKVALAQASRTEAWSGLLPSGGLTYTSQTQRSTTQNPLGGSVSMTQVTGSRGLSASWELDFRGNLSAMGRAAEYGYRASVSELAAAQLTVTSETALSYVLILSLHDQLAQAKKNVQLAERVLEHVRARYDARSATLIELGQQEAIVLDLRAVEVQLERNLALEEQTLGNLSATTPGRLKLSNTSLSNLKIPALDPGQPSDILTRRPDVRMAESQLLASAENVKAARAAMLPGIQLSLEQGYQSSQQNDLARIVSQGSTLGFSLMQPIFNLPKLKAVLRGSQAQRDQLIYNYERAVYSALTDVEKALIGLQTTQREYLYTQQITEITRKSYDNATELMSSGHIDATTLLNAQRDFLSSSNRLNQIRLAQFQAAISLYRALGGGWSQPEIDRFIQERLDF